MSECLHNLNHPDVARFVEDFLQRQPAFRRDIFDNPRAVYAEPAVFAKNLCFPRHDAFVQCGGGGDNFENRAGFIRVPHAEVPFRRLAGIAVSVQIIRRITGECEYLRGLRCQDDDSAPRRVPLLARLLKLILGDVLNVFVNRQHDAVPVIGCGVSEQATHRFVRIGALCDARAVLAMRRAREIRVILVFNPLAAIFGIDIPDNLRGERALWIGTSLLNGVF